MANLSAIKLPNGTTYSLKDSGALQLTGGQVTGPVSFGDSVTMDEVTTGDLVVNGSASFTNNIQANTINGITVGSSPKFTDTTYSNLTAASGGTAVSLVTTGEKYTWNSKTSNTGTVTSVAVSNGGGLSVSGSPITSSGTITISHADTSSQASSSNSGRTYIQSLTLDTYGHVTGISTATETVTNTDEKLKVVEITSATQYYPLVGTATSGTTGAIRQYDTTGFKYKGTSGTTSAVGSSTLELGNSTASGTAGNKQAQLIMYGSNAKKATITLAAPSADIALALPTSAGTLALTSQIPTIPTATQSATTGITASTTATKTTLGTAFTIPNVTSVGSASTWAFEEVSIPNVTSAGSASTWAFEDIACDDITSWSAGSGSASISGAVDSSDSTQLNITISHTHTAPSLQYTARTISSKKSGANSTAPTLGTAIKVQSKKSGANGSAPTLGTAFTVPNVTGNTSATVSVTDPGHTHSI